MTLKKKQQYRQLNKYGNSEVLINNRFIAAEVQNGILIPNNILWT